MPLPPDDIRARLAQLRSEFAMRAALQSEYDKEMSGKYIHEMIPFADWLAQRNAPTGKANGGLAEFLKDSAVKHPMYHGTQKSFDQFKESKIGHWFSPHSHEANRYAGKNEGAQVYRVFLNSKNPLVVANRDEYNAMMEKAWEKGLRGISELAQRNGHDGILIKDSGYFNVFHPHQIKSAIGNRGTYDPNDPDITKAKGGLVWNSPDWKPHPENDLLQPIGASRMIGDERLLSQDDTFSHGLSEFPSSKKSYRYLYHGEDNKPIGAMQIQTAGPRSKKAVIQNLYVAEANRRQGIASKLLDRAREDFDVKHSTDLTTAGRAFARAKKASGGSVPSLDVMRLAIGGQGPRNFLKGTVEKVIEPLKKYDLPDLFPEFGEPPPNSDANKAVNLWIERNLANYIRKQMGHPNDPVRKLAEEGILHFDPESLGIEEEQAEGRRQMLGGQKLAKGPLAQAWENAVDYQFEPNTVEDIKAMPDIYKGAYEPWMDKVDPKTTLYELYEADRLGFDHIVDILKEDLAQGRIRPEQLSKVSIEQAVRRTHQYDQERKKAMAETALKSTEGMPVHKDYGDGFKWIELTLPKDLPTGYGVFKDDMTGGFKVVDESGKEAVDRPVNKLGHINVPFHKTKEEAIAEALKYDKRLEDALKYEGDTMGHCVGGYCPDVAAGKTRIFSLRDAKNEPHVTVEVKPNFMRAHEWLETLSPEERQEVNASQGSITEHPKYLAQKHNVPPMIRQIKGKGNAKPKKDYIPYVQDFVKSGNWSDVDDLQNAEMHHAGNLYTKNERKNLERLTGENMDYVAHQDIPKHRELLKQHNVPPLLPDNKAGGGEVDAEEVFMGKGGKVKELEQYLRQREGEYGVKRLQRAADEIPGLENMYTLQALKEAFGGDNAKALMTMNPADFEKFAVRLFSDPDTREEEMQERIERGHGLPPMSHHEYIEHLAKIKGGFADVPFLEVNKRPEYLPNISGHEGRHRSRAMVAKGAQKSLVRLLPSPSMREPMPRRYREDFIEAMKKELGEKRLVTGEGRSLLPADLEAPEHKNIERRNMLGGRPQLPEIYKDGGDVDPESVFFPKSKE